LLLNVSSLVRLQPLPNSSHNRIRAPNRRSSHDQLNFGFPVLAFDTLLGSSYTSFGLSTRPSRPEPINLNTRIKDNSFPKYLNEIWNAKIATYQGLLFIY
ncbi:MAG: hypothetical protein JXB24_08310, partial [Bacteroidales bacterium]|nr:hypothetical protein [Bacteroidales bacterium]